MVSLNKPTYFIMLWATEEESHVYTWARVFIKWTETWPDSLLATMVWDIPREKVHLEEERIAEAIWFIAISPQRVSLAEKLKSFLFFYEEMDNFHFVPRLSQWLHRAGFPSRDSVALHSLRTIKPPGRLLLLLLSHFSRVRLCATP